MLGLILVLALGAPTNSETDGSLAEENELLKLRLQALEDELQEEKRHSYVVVHGYIAEAENVMMETMDIDQAKAWCNSHKRCKGFTFGGADERPGDEVTVTFKTPAILTASVPSTAGGFQGAPRCELGELREGVFDVRCAIPAESGIGTVVLDISHSGAMNLGKLEEANSPAIIAHGLTFESICIVFALRRGHVAGPHSSDEQLVQQGPLSVASTFVLQSQQ
eukprot:scaffold69075_cov36-Tisochrysis_lutea.AAC.2